MALFYLFLFIMSIICGLLTGIATTHWIFTASKEFFLHTINNIYT